MPTSKLFRASAVSLIIIPLVVACGGSPAQSVAPTAPSPAASASTAASALATATSTSTSTAVASNGATPTPTPTPIPVVPTAAVTATPTSLATKGPDYTGDWGGLRLAGTVKYCGSANQPYWGADIVSNSGDKGFLAYDIPAGSTEPVEAEVVTPFIVPEFTTAAKGTGQFVPGTPPHFVIVNGEGTWDITLKVGSFCSTT